MSTTLERLTEVIQKMTRNSSVEITEATVAADVPGWDSLTHIYIIAESEKEFGIRLSAQEAHNVTSVGDFCHLIDTKTP